MLPPKAKRVPHVHQRHAGPIDDPYAWLRDRDDPDTIAYLEAENAYADDWLARLADLRSAIFDEIKARTKETDLSVPVPHGPWEYFTRTVEGLDYPVHCRRPSSGGARRQQTSTAVDDAAALDGAVLLDENAEAHGEHFALGAFEISPDQHRLAWSCDRDGGEQYALAIRDLDSGHDLADRLVDVAAGGAWGDDATFFYLRLDESMRPHQVWRHVLGTDPSDDVLVFADDDERFWVDVDRTRSGDWLVITSASKTTSEVWILPTADPSAPARLVEPRGDGHEYSVDHWNNRFVITTNDGAEDFKVVTAPLDEPGRAHWVELVGHQAGRRIVGTDPFARHLVVHEWMDATPRLRVLFADGSERVLTFDTAAHDVEPNLNLEYEATSYRFSYQALSVPPQVLSEDVITGERTLLKELPVLGGFDRSRYRTTRVWAPSSDGVSVPVDIVHHVDTPVDASAPCVVYAYGAYEITIPPWFSIARLSLLDRGVVFAVVHARGGGELGRRWYLDGKLAAKANTFTDVIAAAEHLIATGHAAAGRIAVRGGSAGGLMVGAVINRRPELFTAAVAEVPFVDVVTTMSDPSLPLTVTEWEEWGDPRQPDFEAVMAAYSPYDNVVATQYPSLFVTAGLNDPRVGFHEPAKWVARLRAVATGDRPILLRTELGAGHGGPTGRYDAWRDEARLLAFLLDQLVG